MQIDVNATINDFDGNPFPLNPNEPDKAPMRLADVLTTALMAPAHPPGSSYPAAQAIKRYDMALAVHRSRVSGITIDIDAEMAALLKNDIARLYGPMVVGQVLPILDGK